MSKRRPKVQRGPPRAQRTGKVSLSPGELFQPPGSPNTLETRIPVLAANTHEALFRRVAPSTALSDGPAGRLLQLVLCRRTESSRQRLLLDPLFIRYLHSLAPISEAVRDWHRQTAAHCSVTSNVQNGLADESVVGNLILPLILRAEPAWRGQLSLRTDAFGRLRFPTCDWSISLRSDDSSTPEVWVHHPVVVSVERSHFRWSRAGCEAAPFLIMPRPDSWRMLANNDDRIHASALCCKDNVVRPVLRRAARLGATSVCYNPVEFTDHDRAAFTGGLVQMVLAAIGQNSPIVHQELRRYIRYIQGFEARKSEHGFVQSYSDPREPGVIGINVAYSSEGQPIFEPHWFTCFGHELAHTKSYLIDSAAYGARQRLAYNTTDWTESIARYDRPLRVRTLLQIPYTHLYEWVLLIEFLRNDFAGLAWSLPKDVISLGDELQQEIEEAFDLIDECVELTAFGKSVISLLRRQFLELCARWASCRV